MRGFFGIVSSAIVTASLCATGAAGAAAAPKEPADLIVRNAKIFALEEVLPEARALAVLGEKFVAVGPEDQVMMFRGDKTRAIDAGGRRIIPGLNDSHIHAVRGGRFITSNCAGMASNRWSKDCGWCVTRPPARRRDHGCAWSVAVFGGYHPSLEQSR